MSLSPSHALMCADVERFESMVEPCGSAACPGVVSGYDHATEDVTNDLFFSDAVEALEPLTHLPYCLAWLAEDFAELGICPAAWAYDCSDALDDLELDGRQVPEGIAEFLVDYSVGADYALRAAMTEVPQ